MTNEEEKIMKSTDHNLNNPMRIGAIDNSNISDALAVQSLSQEEYDMLATKDPYTMYIINESRDMYIGVMKYQASIVNHMYLLGPSSVREHFTLYSSNTDMFGNTKLCSICSYDNIQTAVNALSYYNNIGGHGYTSKQIAAVINSYIDKSIGIHDLLIGIISIAGFKHDINFQELMNFLGQFLKVVASTTDVPLWFRKELLCMKNSKNPLMNIYSNLYDLVIKYDFFKGHEFQTDPLTRPLSGVLSDIDEIFINYLRGNNISR